MRTRLAEVSKHTGRAEEFSQKGSMANAAKEERQTEQLYRESTVLEHETHELERRAAELEHQAAALDRQEVELMQNAEQQIAKIHQRKKDLRG